MKNVSAGLVVALLLALVLGVGLIQAFTNFTGGIELRPAAPALLQTATMSVGDPKNVDSSTNTFEVDVDIADASNLGAFEFETVYSDTLLSLVSVTHGTWIGGDDGRPASERRDIIPLTDTTQSGLVAVGAATCPVPDCSATPNGIPTPNPGMTGTGTLATIKFNVLGRGVTDLTLSNAQITDIDANVQDMNPPVGATIGVFPYQFVAGTSSVWRNNAFVLAVDPASLGITDFDSLASFIPGAKQIQQWDPTYGTRGRFLTKRVGAPFGDTITIVPGGSYMIAVDDTASPSVLEVGSAINPSFSLQPGTSTICRNNFISIPAGKESIQAPEDLANDIGNNSVVQVQKWDPSYGSRGRWLTKRIGAPFGDTITIEVGDAIMVCLNDQAPANWP